MQSQSARKPLYTAAYRREHHYLFHADLPSLRKDAPEEAKVEAVKASVAAFAKAMVVQDAIQEQVDEARLIESNSGRAVVAVSEHAAPGVEVPYNKRALIVYQPLPAFSPPININVAEAEHKSADLEHNFKPFTGAKAYAQHLEQVVNVYEGTDPSLWPHLDAVYHQGFQDAMQVECVRLENGIPRYLWQYNLADLDELNDELKLSFATVYYNTYYAASIRLYELTKPY